MNDFTERTDSLISVVNNWQRSAEKRLFKGKFLQNIIYKIIKIIYNTYIILLKYIKANINISKYNFLPKICRIEKALTIIITDQEAKSPSLLS